MQLTMSKTKNFNYKDIENTLIKENKFITDLFSILPLPLSAQRIDEDDEEDVKVKQMSEVNGTTRAKSLQELHQRLEAITKSKHKLTYKDKLLKKGLKNRMKKKTKQDERNAQKKLVRAQKIEKAEIKSEEQKEEPAVNSESNKMLFTKINFPNAKSNKKTKEIKDPKKLLKNLEKQKEKLSEIEASGDKEKVVKIKESTTWKNALGKAEGKKIKDDINLLKKSIKKKEQKKKSTKKKWEARKEGVMKAKEERQKKRTENIDKKKKEKKLHKMKTAVKKGKIIPGF